MSQDDGYIYLPAPLDVVTALEQRSWDDDVSDDDRQLLEVAALSLKAALNRTVTLASALEKTEAEL
jgi:hypothetical protein